MIFSILYRPYIRKNIDLNSPFFQYLFPFPVFISYLIETDKKNRKKYSFYYFFFFLIARIDLVELGLYNFEYSIF